MRKDIEPARENPDGITVFLLVMLAGLVVIWLWTMPLGGFAAGFAPSGAMAALMGVFLAVALKKHPN